MRRLDGEVIARLDKILQEAPSNRELKEKEKEKSRKDLGDATWNMNDKAACELLVRFPT